MGKRDGHSHVLEGLQVEVGVHMCRQGYYRHTDDGICGERGRRTFNHDLLYSINFTVYCITGIDFQTRYKSIGVHRLMLICLLV